MEFRGIFVSAIIVGLFAFCLISFMIGIGEENNTQVNVNDNQFVEKMFSSVNSTLEANRVNTTSAGESIQKETSHPTLTALGYAFSSILHAVNTFWTVGVNMFSYIFLFAQETLGINPIVIGTITAILIGVLGLAAWSLIRSGR